MFCKGTDAFVLGKIKASSKVKEQLLLAISGKSLRALRDRALIGLLIKNNLRVDNLVNVPVQNYFNSGNTQLLRAAGASQQYIPISKKVKKLIDQYIKAAGLTTKGPSPFLQKIDTKKRTTTNEALCTADIRKIIINRARAAKIRPKVKILS